jgi:hypothetical protein
VVDKGIAAKFPRVGTVEVAATRPMKRDLVMIERLELDGTVFTNVTAGVSELKEPWEGRAPLGSHIELSSSHEAIVGKGFLERSHAILHVGASTLYLRLDPPTAKQTNLLAKTLAVSGMTNVPLADVGPHVWGVTANFNGHAATLLLDTGTFATTIDSTAAEAWGITGKHTQIDSFGTDNRKSTGMITRIELLEICGCRLVNYPVEVGDLSPWGIGTKAERAKPVAGLMGNDVLARANALFDCHNGGLWVVPKTVKE